MRKLAAPALILTLALCGCPSSEDNSGSKSGGSGGTASGGSSGSSGSGGSSGSSGSGGSASGGSSGSGAGGSSTGGSSGSGAGGSSTGGASGAGGRTGSGGSGGAKADSAGGAMDGPAAYFKSTCAYPVLSGFTPDEFCTAYTEICGYMGTGRYASEADCKSKFKGLASDSDACKAGHLCRAFKLPMLKKEMDCASAGTSSCNRND